MKRFSSSDSLGAMVSICPPNEDGSSKINNGYSREFQAMLDSFDEEDGAEETSIIINGKKRRLSLEKVKALEKYFEVDNKLEPERKAKIAEELNLQPRQVAIWFQNRRARWKAKQLEKDYGFLKSDYDALKHNYDRLEREKSTLNAEVRELKSKLGGMNENGDYSVVKEEALFSESENNVSEQSKISPGGFCGESDSNILGLKRLVEFKDGSSDSDSSEMQILNDTNLHHHHLWIPPTSSSFPMNWFQFSNTREMAAKVNQQQFGKVEEQSFYGITEESCSFFPLDQSPTMHRYNLDQ